MKDFFNQNINEVTKGLLIGTEGVPPAAIPGIMSANAVLLATHMSVQIVFTVLDELGTVKIADYPPPKLTVLDFRSQGEEPQQEP